MLSEILTTNKPSMTKHGDCAPPLTAKLAPWMNDLIKEPAMLKDWLELEGSPLHVVVTSEFKRNIKDLLKPFSERGVGGGLFFGRKANKLSWFVTAAKEEGIGIDTSSLEELRETLQLGVDPKNIVITAVGKEKELISLAIGEGCLLIIDNLDELQLVQSAAQALNKPARTGLRIAGFYVNGRQIFSRFGFPIITWPELIAKVREDHYLKLEVLHAHLDRYDIQERVCATEQLIELVDHAASLGCQISSLDLGGGILMRYLESEAEWNNFLINLRAAVAGERTSFTYLADGLGYQKIGQEIFGKTDFYPEWNNVSKERFIAAILDSSENGETLHKAISTRGLKLFFEPGRALLDNVGITLAIVAFRKRDTLGNLLIGLSMNKTNLYPFRTEFCMDPIFINTENRENISEGAFLVGYTLSEGDTILKRKICLNHLPMLGDIVCFPNTAGYYTHFMESQVHKKFLPKNALYNPITKQIQAIETNF